MNGFYWVSNFAVSAIPASQILWTYIQLTRIINFDFINFEIFILHK